MSHDLPALNFLRRNGRNGTGMLKNKHLVLLLALTVGSLPTLPVPGFMQVAQAQSFGQRNPNAQLYMTADELIYDNDKELVTASGNVQMEYDGFYVVANRVSYNQKTRRVKAFGNVEILERGGNRIYAQEIDITDDFGQGFVNALRVETPDNTSIAAASAERFADQKSVFNHGIYTACEPCKEKPDQAPIWQIKAHKVILDGVEKTVSYRHATFELYGFPIAYLPYFSHADGSVKRKTGFLISRLGSGNEFGFWGKHSYFIATGDTHDLTLSVNHYAKQGILGQAKWRHQLENGYYEMTSAAISQRDRQAFNKGTVDRQETDRGMIGSKARFDINPRWIFGWDVLAQSDSNFSRTYDIENYTASTFTNQAFLRGLHDRSFFDLSTKRYLVQNSTLTAEQSAFVFESEQPTVLPTFDYNYVANDDITDGEFHIDVNVASIVRRQLSSTVIGGGLDALTYGINGETARGSADVSWKKTSTTGSGLSFTSSLSMRGDVIATQGFSNPLPTAPDVSTGSYARFMPTAGLEIRYPVLATTAGASHVFEPIAQLYARPDLAFSGVAPNEDAQSMVFDATTLFQRDKFSGYDRIESGTRTNLGLRYAALFDNGLSLNGVVGQSIHLTGDNPYSRQDDLVNAGQESGLETDRSDFVASLGATGNHGLLLNVQARFDETDFGIKRSDLTMAYNDRAFSLSTNYTYIDAQPSYGFNDERQQIGFASIVDINDNWKVFGGAQYNVEADIVVSDSLGLTYHDECFTLSLGFKESRSTSVAKTSRSLSSKIGLRTIGDYEHSFNDSQYEDFADQNNF